MHPTVQAVAEHNVAKFLESLLPPSKMVRSSGLEALICLVRGARIMLTSNLWTDAGLVNRAMGTVQAICYQSGGSPSLPVAVMLRFDKYWGPTLHDGSVPIVPQ